MIKKITTGKHKGEWLIRIQPRDKATGKRKVLPRRYADNKRKAVLIENQMWLDFENGVDVNLGKAVFADEFQKYVNNRSKSISPVTLKTWQDSANAFKEYFGNAKINQVSTEMVEAYAHDYVQKHNVVVSNSSNIAKRLVQMRNFFSSLVGKVIKENPVPEKALKLFLNRVTFQLSKNGIFLRPMN